MLRNGSSYLFVNQSSKHSDVYGSNGPINCLRTRFYLLTIGMISVMTKSFSILLGYITNKWIKIFMNRTFSFKARNHTRFQQVWGTLLGERASRAFKTRTVLRTVKSRWIDTLWQGSRKFWLSAERKSCREPLCGGKTFSRLRGSHRGSHTQCVLHAERFSDSRAKVCQFIETIQHVYARCDTFLLVFFSSNSGNSLCWQVSNVSVH